MTATTIKFKFRPAQGDSGYLRFVSNATWGNMVDPVTGDYWDSGPTGESEWIWYARSAPNNNPFALMGNYYYAGTNPGEKTSFSKVVAVPAKMTDGDHVVEAVLYTATIGPSNQILRFWAVYVDGRLQGDQGPLAYVNEWGTAKPQPPSTFEPPPSSDR